MSTHQHEENEFDEAREEALTEAEAPGQVLDPLAEPVGTRGTRHVVSEYDEEDARTRPAEDGINPAVPEDENLRVSGIENFEDELEDGTSIRRNPNDQVETD